MHFNAHIEITIAGKLLKTIVAFNSKFDGHSIGGECEIIVPLNSRIQYVDGKNDYLTAYSKVLFNVGDSVLVRSKYEGYDWNIEFDGFIYDFKEGTPLTIKCLDYVYFFNLGIFGSKRVLLKKNTKSKKSSPSVGCSFKLISLYTLLQHLVDFVNDTIDVTSSSANHVELILPIPEMNLENVTFAMMCPSAILEWIKKELGFNISLIGNNLYVNVASNTLDKIEYTTSRNVKSSELQKAGAAFTMYKVKAWFIRNDGTKDSFEVGNSNGQLREVFFYRVKRDAGIYEKMALEALEKVKQMKYNGNISTYLYPFPKLFAKAIYTDKRYPDKNANYVITYIETDISSSGYQRTLKLSFLSEI